MAEGAHHTAAPVPRSAPGWQGVARRGVLALDRLHAGLARRGMRHVLSGLSPLILLVLLFPAGPGARAADPASPAQHDAVPVTGAHPAVSPAVHGASPSPVAHPASPGAAHPVATKPVPVAAASGPARPGHAPANGAHPGPRGPIQSGSVHSGLTHPGLAHLGPARRPIAPPPVVEPAPPPAEPDKGSNTGLPLPRWSALRTEEVNLRTGPGTRYPIDWVYKRRDLPVKVEREFDVWRLVALPDGTKGWVSGATLVTHRTFSVVGGGRRGGAAQARGDRAHPGVRGGGRVVPGAGRRVPRLAAARRVLGDRPGRGGAVMPAAPDADVSGRKQGWALPRPARGEAPPGPAFFK